MRVDMFNRGLHGGAALAALRLHHGLLLAGVESRFWCAEVAAEQAGHPSYRVFNVVNPGRTALGKECYRLRVKLRRAVWRYRWRRAVRQRPDPFDLFSAATLPSPTPFAAGDRGDVVHLHWVARFLDTPSFFASIPDDFPLVWTLHDMQPLTGGCHYASGCEAYADQCGHCPQLAVRGPRDLANHSFRVKRQCLEHKNLHIVTPSHWLEREARRSGVFSAARSFRTIPYGLDTELFRPRNKLAARETLGLPHDALVAGFGADSLATRRKGFAELLDALTLGGLPSRIVGLAFGHSALPAGGAHPPFRQIGFVQDPQLQAAVYSAMDFLVLPSLEDNSPLIGLEAMACGVPVVAFDAGGIRDYVRPTETGLLARVRDADDLAGQILWMVDHTEHRQRMGQNARRLILREYCQQNQVQRYRELYAQLVDERQNRTSRRAAA